MCFLTQINSIVCCHYELSVLTDVQQQCLYIYILIRSLRSNIKKKVESKLQHPYPLLITFPIQSICVETACMGVCVWVKKWGGGGLRNVKNQDTYIFNPSKKIHNFKFIYFLFIFGVFFAVSNFHECIIKWCCKYCNSYFPFYSYIYTIYIFCTSMCNNKNQWQSLD